MKTARERAEEWMKKNRGLDYDRSLNNLERLIIDIKKEQDKITRHACRDAIARAACICADGFERVPLNNVEEACMNVKDRLPIMNPDSFDVYESFDVLTFDGIRVESCYFSAGKVPEFWTSFERDNVTHWMPLPEPPQ